MWDQCGYFPAAFVALMCCGCSHWSATTSDYSLLDPPRMSPDSVVLELALLDLRSDDQDDADHLWQEVDEQHLEADVRRKLAAHGLRCGVMGAHLPDWICRGLQDQMKHLQLDRKSGMAVPSDIMVQRRLQCRAGKQRRVPIGAAFEKLNVVDAEGESVEYSDGQSLLAITASPQGDGRVSLNLVPEIHHGEPRLHWVGSGGQFRSDITLDRTVFDNMAIEITLRPGQTIVLAAAPEVERLGGAICQSETTTTPPSRLVLLRLAQTQSDDLFAPHKTLTPIATLAE